MKKKKILVIHPEDTTTEFLSNSYKRVLNDSRVVRYPGTTSSSIRDYIREAEVVILLGHGTECGLLADAYGKRFSRYIVSSKNVEELRKKKMVIGIWCNANIFFYKYRIPGFSTGMFISEEKEAIEEGYGDYTEEIEPSNNLFTSILRIHLPELISGKISGEDFMNILGEKYSIGPITKFNLEGMSYEE